MADLAATVDDFFIGEDGAEGFAPPDGGFGDVGEAVGVAVGAAFGVGADCGGKGRVAMGSARRVAG
jgi:hypothetical protein